MKKKLFTTFSTFLYLFIAFSTSVKAVDMYWTAETGNSDGVFEIDSTSTLLFGTYRNYYGCFLFDVPSFDINELKIYINEHGASGYTKVYICPTERKQFNAFDCSSSGSDMEILLNKKYCKYPFTYLGEFSVGGFNKGWNTLRFSPYRLYGGNYILWFYNYDMKGNDISNVDGFSDNFYFYRSAYSCADNYAIIAAICNIKLGGTEIKSRKNVRSLSDSGKSLKNNPTSNTNAADTTTTTTRLQSNTPDVTIWAAIITVSFIVFLIAFWVKLRGKTEME